MAEYSAAEMKDLLDQYPKFKDKLYCRGFLLTNSGEVAVTTDYPFYGNWKEESLARDYKLFLHKDTDVWSYRDGEALFFIVGHAYDPFEMLSDEYEILRRLAAARRRSEAAFWEEESNLTGIFLLGYINEEGLVYSTDCTGMQLTYHGIVKGSLYITSHSKLVADLCGLKQDPYVVKLVNSKFYRYFGIVLPGDLFLIRS